MAAPPIPVERLLRRLAWGRVRIATFGLVAVLGSLLALLLSRGEPQPPVNLELRVVNLAEPMEVPAREPPELNLP